MQKIYTAVFITILLIITSTVIAQDEDLFEPKSSIGGYGELHYNNEKADGKDAKKVLDFHRFVLFFGYAWNEQWSLKSEVELEHNFVKDGQGELELEQAYINYHHADWFGFQAGVILPSVGLLNEYHEPPLFLSVERPEYSKNIIPTTWFGNGVALYGSHEGFEYKLSVMEGLNSDNFKSSSGIRSGRQKGYKADAENFLYNGRVDYTGLPGLRAGVSFTYNKANGDSTEVPLTLIEFHAKYTANNIHAVFEYGNISYSDQPVESSMGYYFDLGYNVASFFCDKMEVIPFFRWTDYNTVSSFEGGGDAEKKYHNKKWMVGLSVKPIPQVVFKLDYGVRENQLTNSEVKLFNLGAGYMF